METGSRGNCFTGSELRPGTDYLRSQAPFISFTRIRENPTRCKLIVPATDMLFLTARQRTTGTKVV